MDHELAKEKTTYNVFEHLRTHIFEVVPEYDIMSGLGSTLEAVMCLKEKVPAILHRNAPIYFTSVLRAH